MSAGANTSLRDGTDSLVARIERVVRSSMLAAVAAPLLTVGSQAALAQGVAAKATSDTDAAAKSQEPIELDTVTVTATRRVESIQEVKMTVNALTTEEIERRGVRNTLDVIQSVPGVAMTRPNSGLTNITIRGIGSDAAAPTVGFYVDDIAVSSRQTPFIGTPDPYMFDVERVEVLKGPQGTLYGTSAMGGAVKLVSRRPELGRFSYNVGTEFGVVDKGSENYEGRGVVNIPVGDVVAGRVGVLYRKNGGFIDRVPNGLLSTGATSVNTVGEKDANDSESIAVRASVLIQPSDTFRILPAVSHQKNSFDNVDRLWLSLLPNLAQSNLIDQPTTNTTDLFTLNVEKSFDFATLTSISGYYERDMRAMTDFSTFIGSLAAPLRGRVSTNYTSGRSFESTEELRLASNGSGPFSWLLGGYYSRETLNSQQDALSPGSTAAVRFPPPAGGVNDILFTSTGHSFTRQVAAFGEVSYKWWDRLTTSAGLRWYQYDLSFRSNGNGIFNGGATSASRNSDSSGTVPRFSVGYDLAPGHMAYLSAQKGFRLGSTNGRIPAGLCTTALNQLGLTSAPDAFEADNLWSYELGSKNTFEQGRLVVNAAAFYNDWKKLQQVVALSASGLNCGFSFTANVGAAHSQGGELEVRSRVMRELDLSVGVAYTDSVIDEGAPGVAAKPGDPVLFAPKMTLNGSADWQRDLASGLYFGLRADHQYRTKQYTTFTPGPAQIEAGYGLTNVSARIGRDSKWSARLFVDNATNRNPRLVYANFGNVDLQVLRPRTVGISVQLQD